MIVFAFILLCILTLRNFSKKEGLEDDILSIVIRSIETTMKDKRINEQQIIALEDALSYAKHIKNI
jgi:hypothetical protein